MNKLYVYKEELEDSKKEGNMSENKTLHILSTSELFKGLTIDDLKKLYSYCQKVEFKETDTLIKEGQIVSELYINQRASRSFAS